MSDNADRGQVRASAAEVYDQFFVPALFGQFAEPVLDAARVGAGHHVLDVGCGTGNLARCSVTRVGMAGRVVGVDPNPGMLAVAGRASEVVEWRGGVAEELPFDDDSFDRVVSAFALMFFVDPAAAAAEMARVVGPGGRVAVATWASVEASPGYARMVELLRERCGEPAADALMAPFCLGEPAAVKAVLEPHFGAVEVHEHPGTARFASIEAWVHTDVRGWTLADMIDDAQYAELLAAAHVDLAEFVGTDGRVAFPAPALIAAATPTG